MSQAYYIIVLENKIGMCQAISELFLNGGQGVTLIRCDGLKKVHYKSI